MRLLVVEDNRRLLTLVRAGLERAGFATDGVSTAADAAEAVRSVAYAAMVLDLGLPDGDGLEMLQRLRASGQSLPVLVLTARGGLEDRVRGLDAGADDYLPKPFAQQELAARLRALVRRSGPLQGNTLEFGAIALDTLSREVRVHGHMLPIAPREVSVLEVLLRRVGHVVPKSLVEDHLFGLSAEFGSNAVEVYVHRLRRQLVEAGAAAAIQTVRGVGYILRRQDEDTG